MAAEYPVLLPRAAFDLTPNYDIEKNVEQAAGTQRPKLFKRGVRRVVTFATRHIRGRLTLGYKVVETMRRLKPRYAALSQEEIRAHAIVSGPEGVQELTEEYEATLVAFGGDGLPLDPAAVQGTELLVHEATILDAQERKHQWHATLDEAVQVASTVQPKALLLYHISGRYQTSDIVQAIGTSARRYGVKFPVWCLYRDRLACFWKGESDLQTPPTQPRRSVRGDKRSAAKNSS